MLELLEYRVDRATEIFPRTLGKNQCESFIQNVNMTAYSGHTIYVCPEVIF